MAEKVAAPAKAAPSGGAKTPSAPPMNWSNFLTIFIFGIAMIVLFDQDLGPHWGDAVGLRARCPSSASTTSAPY